LSSDPKTFTAYYQGFLGGKLFRWLDFNKVRIICEVLAELGDTPSIVDLGCGTGSIDRRVRTKCRHARITGVDHDPRLLAMALGPDCNRVSADFNRPLPFGDGSFDAVLMVDTIEHVASRATTLEEASRILKETGKLIVFTPPYDTLPWLLGERFFKLVTRRALEHISPFTRESLSWALSSRFHEWEVGYTNFGLTLWGVAGRKHRLSG
jgi:ubiquinone/menaquinone biosynthesis C-methylase UbiE